MMNSNAFKEVFVTVVAEMAFMDVVPMKEEDATEKLVYAFKLPILMPYFGDVIVAFPDKVAGEMAKNILGNDTRSSVSDIKDSVAELLNVLVGRYFEYAEPGLLFELGLPVLLEVRELSRADLCKQYFMTPGGAFVLLMHPSK